MSAPLYASKLGNNADQWAVIEEGSGADKAITLNDRGGQFAALIAAAPELLSALELFETFRSQLGKPGATVSIADVSNAARAAIAKAKGE